MAEFTGWRWCFAFLIFAATVITASGQAFTTLVTFNGIDGDGPAFGPLVQGVDGKYYGTTNSGGTYKHGPHGTVFRTTADGDLTVLYSFGSDGEYPLAGLVLAPDGNFYGTTDAGGYDGGTVFGATLSDEVTTLYRFCPTFPVNYCPNTRYADGQNPMADLALGVDGSFYGTTYFGGASNAGTVFKIGTDGEFKTIYSFCALQSCADGEYPFAGLTVGTDGNLYGVAQIGGTSNDACPAGCGTIFQLTTDGRLTTLYQFGGMNGALPDGTLSQASNGDLYGTTIAGGGNGPCVPDGCGTIFRVSTSGSFTSLYSFCIQSGCQDGAYPVGKLIQATDGNLYGTTSGLLEQSQGTEAGTVFRITPDGKVTTLYSFCQQTNCSDGQDTLAGLLQATSGIFYGTTALGGTSNNGQYLVWILASVPLWLSSSRLAKLVRPAASSDKASPGQPVSCSTEFPQPLRSSRTRSSKRLFPTVRRPGTSPSTHPLAC